MRKSRPRRRSAAWDRAVEVHAHLLAGGGLMSLEAPPPDVPTDHGEYAVGDFPASAGFAMRYERLLTAEVTWVADPSFAVGPPGFVAAHAVGAAARRARLRTMAERATRPDWHVALWHRTVVTTHRLWCTVSDTSGPARALHFNYAAITGMELASSAMTLTFQGSPPLRLTGEWVPWCAAVIAHYRFGTAAAQVVPELC